MLFLRASGRPMDRFASVPKTLLRAICEAFQTPAVSIASLRSLYARRQTLYEHQAWARTYLGLLDLDAAGVDQLQKVLVISALEAAHPDDLAETARMWLYERRIVSPGPRRLADLAREAFDATEAAMAATIEAGVGKAALLKAIDWCYATHPGGVGTRLEWLFLVFQRRITGCVLNAAKNISPLRLLRRLCISLIPIIARSKSQMRCHLVQFLT